MKGRLFESQKIVQAFTPKDRSAANTLYNDAAIGDAVGIDCKGFEDALISIILGVVGATTIDFAVGFADVNDAEDSSFALLSGATKQIVNADDGKVFLMGIRTKDVGRYMFVKAVQADAVSVVYNVAVALGQAQNEPVTQEQTVAFTHGAA